MSPDGPEDARPNAPSWGEAEHPRGTLVIVTIFGVLFAAAWLAMYLIGFLGRGAPHP
jgi:hypothetical protein